jgi:TolB-like protein
MSFFAELRRRNVIKVAAAYVIVGWLIMQAGEVMAPALRLPDWTNSALAFFVILGFPIALFFAWAFELTPEGIRKEKDVDRSQSVTAKTGRKLDFAIIGLLAIGLVYFIWESRFASKGSEPFSQDSTEQAADAEAEKRALTPAGEPEQPAPDKTIAVLPFVNMSDDASNEYFSDGLSEELLNLLVKVPELQVAARTSSFSFKGQNMEIPEIAARLGVAHVLEGSVRKSGNQVRITAQLVRADSGFHLWSESYDRTLDNIFQIQDEIAIAVVEALKVTLLGAAPEARETDPEAYELFLEGRYYSLKRSMESFPQAIELFQAAVDIDPTYAPAWAEMASAYQWYAGSGGMSIEDGLTSVKTALDQALATDPDLALAYFVRGVQRGMFQFDFEGAMEDWQHARELRQW